MHRLGYAIARPASQGQRLQCPVPITKGMHMRNVVWMSRERFLRETPNKDTIAISIINSLDDTQMRENPSLKGWHPDSIQLCFDDATPTDCGNTFVVMTQSQADIINEVVKKHLNKVSWIIHCEAGFSRSAAVARFIGEMTELPLIGMDVFDTRFANTFVLSLLHRRAIGEQ